MQKLIKITIPDDVKFSDLKLVRDPESGDVMFDWEPIRRICEASSIDVAIFRDSTEDNVASLLTHWYGEHLKRGGDPDPVQEDLIAEMRAEDEHGGLSHQPGRA